ncbi:uncharacterized protein A4U43_C05F18320 [Asparagus officinalis]|uniref:gibberellin 2beta-dioxygenase n=1 Tax=Asparagus officinalis TaxID=4686 RepID=A0A5P1ESI3_ASPOF|nr:gibberellin 2-beta-dioxygenase-like [Asparagus officinalis]ONK69008.1 uncharacterized protein A4U43_C05F18320 [Asparagus officinalis]
MVVLANPPTEQISIIKPQKPHAYFSGVPVIDLSTPGSDAAIVRACEEFGFFKVTNHGVSKELMAKLEAEAVKFFSLPQFEKEKAGPPNPSGYGNKRIGPNGDVGWVEYLLFEINSKPMSSVSLAFLREPLASSFRSALNEYISAIRNLAAEVLELMAQGLGMKQRDILSKLVMSQDSDLMFRLNHYPPCPVLKELNCNLTGFGEHTDPQVISILRSNNSNGFQIALKDGGWVSVPPDQDSFFINAGDTLQVLTNGRFRSVRHRVVTNGSKSRVSMIFFGGPPPNKIITPLPQLLGEEKKSRYIELTWADYKKAAYKSRLADNRLALFEKHMT